MPPRSFYNSPRAEDYVAYAAAFFPEELEAAKSFGEKHEKPYITSSAHIAAYLGVSSSLIRQIMHKPEYHYRTFPMKKSDGSDRLISTPKTYLKVIQWWILDNILDGSRLDNAAHGFRKGRSYFSNAYAHFGSKHILNVDIKSFFDSIQRHHVLRVFSDLGYEENGSFVLTALVTRNGVAPTGAPTSPMIANLIFRDADEQLSIFAAENGLKYTRYADDLTFSGQDKISHNVLASVSKIVEATGFVLNVKKTKFMGRGDRQDVTGLIINDGLNMPREWRNWARGFLHRVSLDPSSYEREVHRVRGIYGILKQIDGDHSKALTRVARTTLNTIAASSGVRDSSA
ncbi:MAG TPA: reverse transcriptase domain-containing protein [Rhizobiaceae bacterium]|nr:reverse transcriptase domain-containing protein [Rhizobiaceae bacterium]